MIFVIDIRPRLITCRPDPVIILIPFLITISHMMCTIYIDTSLHIFINAIAIAKSSSGSSFYCVVNFWSPSIQTHFKCVKLLALFAGRVIREKLSLSEHLTHALHIYWWIYTLTPFHLWWRGGSPNRRKRFCPHSTTSTGGRRVLFVGLFHYRFNRSIHHFLHKDHSLHHTGTQNNTLIYLITTHIIHITFRRSILMRLMCQKQSVWGLSISLRVSRRATPPHPFRY